MITLKLSTEKKHTVSPYLYMQFMEPLGVCDSSVDAAWDFTEEEWYPQVIEKVRELSPPMVRFGGCFASYYHWKEAIGPYNERTPMKNYCWNGIYSNRVGTHEFADFCRRVDAEPLMVVNMESDGRRAWSHPKNDTVRLGTAEEAAEWVSYCNCADNPLRLQKGSSEPYNFRYWQIGNETSYDSSGFSSDQCVEVTRRFVEKMRAADPSIKLIGWGDYSKRDKSWCKKMSEVDGIDLIAFHHHYDSGLPDSPLVGTEYRRDYANTWHHLLNAYKSMEEHIAELRADCGGKRLAMTEGHFVLPGRNRNEVLSSWGAGVAYARCHNVIMRNSDILDIATMADFFGNVWQVNALMIPTPIKSGEPYLQPVGSVMSLFRHHLGQNAVDISYSGDIDAVASITDCTLFVHVANLSMSASQTLRLDIGGKKIKSAKAYYIASAPDVEITFSNPDVFKVCEADIEGDTFKLPPAGVSAIEIEFEN